MAKNKWMDQNLHIIINLIFPHWNEMKYLNALGAGGQTQTHSGPKCESQTKLQAYIDSY